MMVPNFLRSIPMFNRRKCERFSREIEEAEDTLSKNETKLNDLLEESQKQAKEKDTAGISGTISTMGR